MSEMTRTVGAGGVARLASAPFGPRIAFEKPEGAGSKSAEDLAIEVKAALDRSVDAVKAVAEQALGEAKVNGGVVKATAEKADEALLKMGSLREEMDRLQQKIAARGASEPAREKSIGEQFTASDNYQNFLKSSSRRGRATVEFQKAILTSDTADNAGAVGDAIRATRLPGILALPQQRLTIRDLVSPGRMDGNAIEYVQETGFTNAAAPVAEGSRKPESDIKLNLVTTSAKVLAHYMKASRQVMDDISQLRSVIDQRLLYGLGLVEENQILNGDGIGQNLLGIIPQATDFVPPITVPTPTSIDIIRLAILQVYLAQYPATGIVLHPSDWCAIELLKDTLGRYIIGNPQGTIPARLWGLPVVESMGMTEGDFLVGAFKQGAQIFDRWSASVTLATENEDDFVKNLVTLLAEERLALAVYRPEAFVTGTLAAVGP